MRLAMMPSARRHGELIAGLAAERSVLRMGICRPVSANQARLFGHEPDVLLVTAPWFRVGQPALVESGTGLNWSPLERRGQWPGRGYDERWLVADLSRTLERCQLGLEIIFDCRASAAVAMAETGQSDAIHPW
jgi:hypothetical protein